MDIKVDNIFNACGLRMHPNDGRVVSNFIVQALKGEDITIYRTGQQTRSFRYVDDMVEGFVPMIATERGFTDPVNLGNPGECTMLELTDKVLLLVGSKSTLLFRPLPVYEPKQRQPDISLAKTQLNWTPKVNLEDGLKETVHYLCALLNA